MKKTILLLLLLGSIIPGGCDTLAQLPGVNTGTGQPGLSNADVVNGLRQALEIGAQNSSNILSQVNGYFGNAAVKILMPPEAQKVEQTLRNLGLGSIVDKATLSMNRAAEDAAKSAAPIFINAIKQMSIQDAMQILSGGQHAATDYLKKTTTGALTTAFQPVIQKSLQQVDATKYWSDVFSTYNKFSLKKVNPDLTAYVTEKALDGLFYNISLEEAKIRTDPAARATDLLKKVFAKQ